MNFDLNAKSSPQHRRPTRRPAPQKSPTASVPISVYRELSAELQATQAMLDSLHGQNQNLRKQNLHLQQEVDSIVQAAQKRQYMVQNPSHPETGQQVSTPPASPNVVSGPAGVEVPPQLHRSMPNNPKVPHAAIPPRVSEPPRPQEMPIMPQQGVAPLSVPSPEAMPPQPPSQVPPQGQVVQSQGQATAPFTPSRRQSAVETLNKIFTGREQPLPRPALDEESSEDIHTGWLVLIVLLIVVTAFGTGFMIVRPFLATNR